MRTYIPIAIIEARDPEWAARVRERDRKKCARLRDKDVDRARAKGRELYARNPEQHLARKKAWREANPEKAKAIKQKYARENRAKYIVQSIRSEAKQKGVRFDISAEWVQERLDRGVCELSGFPFNLDVFKDKPSVDRIIPGGDYVEDNCRLILFGLNCSLGRSGNAGVPRAVARIHELRSGG